MLYTYEYNNTMNYILGKNLEEAKLNTLIESFFRSFSMLNNRIKYGFNYMETDEHKTLSGKILNRINTITTDSEELSIIYKLKQSYDSVKLVDETTLVPQQFNILYKKEQKSWPEYIKLRKQAIKFVDLNKYKSCIDKVVAIVKDNNLNYKNVFIFIHVLDAILANSLMNTDISKICFVALGITLKFNKSTKYKKEKYFDFKTVADWYGSDMTIEEYIKNENIVLFNKNDIIWSILTMPTVYDFLLNTQCPNKDVQETIFNTALEFVISNCGTDILPSEVAQIIIKHVCNNPNKTNNSVSCDWFKEKDNLNLSDFIRKY